MNKTYWGPVCTALKEGTTLIKLSLFCHQVLHLKFQYLTLGGEFILVVFGVGSYRAVIAWPILMIRVTYCECSSPNEGKVSKKLPCRWTSMVSRTESDWKEGRPKKISSILGVQVLFLICIMSPGLSKVYTALWNAVVSYGQSII
jgi:hypothetical protein